MKSIDQVAESHVVLGSDVSLDELHRMAEVSCEGLDRVIRDAYAQAGTIDGDIEGFRSLAFPLCRLADGCYDKSLHVIGVASEQDARLAHVLGELERVHMMHAGLLLRIIEEGVIPRNSNIESVLCDADQRLRQVMETLRAERERVRVITTEAKVISYLTSWTTLILDRSSTSGKV